MNINNIYQQPVLPILVKMMVTVQELLMRKVSDATVLQNTLVIPAKIKQVREIGQIPLPSSSSIQSLCSWGHGANLFLKNILWDMSLINKTGGILKPRTARRKDKVQAHNFIKVGHVMAQLRRAYIRQLNGYFQYYVKVGLSFLKIQRFPPQLYLQVIFLSLDTGLCLLIFQFTAIGVFGLHGPTVTSHVMVEPR